MQIGKWTALLLLWVAAGCGTFYVRPTESHALTPAQIADVENGVRVFARSVAQDVTRDGPAAWRRHFADLPQFFMAANGKMVFPDSATASMGIQDLASVIKKIELRWGDDLRRTAVTSRGRCTGSMGAGNSATRIGPCRRRRRMRVLREASRYGETVRVAELVRLH
jgi:hypothetical protein